MQILYHKYSESYCINLRNGDPMKAILIIAIVSCTIIVVVKLFVKDNIHDLEISIGKFHFSISKHK